LSAKPRCGAGQYREKGERVKVVVGILKGLRRSRFDSAVPHEKPAVYEVTLNSTSLQDGDGNYCRKNGASVIPFKIEIFCICITSLYN